ncbi:MAG: chromosome segregation protein SMC [Deltaproteobacteria bacterium RIFCSPLOWO2_12_FULL_43_16]|nr:MAG: chromosome segregation protein SMC [Deltaproteobacteria bacterium GWA2_43_19]OGQ10874.1 MAG: chromosome segregation protein SMC [Deltaproteobacteria bacterium RIFCSPHIGHO2_02_FULL_43_33]OGQ59967.1 MAG: chromosome segregation protein SMC [Deltaproteobacteria bacterium RIFCSPLOWO2_12_FULL_43_16]
MKIKKLEVHGFKSFVDKSVLVFPKGVTGIVGPNGCGKSNIVDAIRWVLGEQNARHLRGKLMEDIIFNGSESRKPIGMSEVVLTLSNEEGIAPAAYVNFTEIEIARRLYRSGESEYYINKVQCRLKDIVDLFTDTGIGTRAYSIIEQGQVGWLVNAKPEDRRALFEEAAGINKYKHRKDAALRRLDATKQNLTRVSDIINEVKRQMNSLNRQAKKAEKYKVMREELKGFELFLSSEEHKTLKQKRTESEKRLEMLKERDIELSTAVSQKQSNLEDVRARYIKEESALKDIRQKAFEIDSNIKDKEKELQASEMRAAELKRNEERLVREIDGMNAQQNNLRQEIEGLNKLLDEMRIAVEGEESRLLNEEDSLRGIANILAQKDESLKQKKEGFINLVNRTAHIKNNIAACLRDEEGLSLKLGKSLREKEELEQATANYELRITNYKSRKSEIENNKQNIEKTQELTAEQLKALEESLIQKDNELSRLKEELTHISSRLHTLKELEKNFEGFHDGVRAIMLNKKEHESEYKLIHGLVADVLETSAQYEKAVEAVLGERLQYVIVESHNEGVEAVDYLRTQAKGRGSFVPLKEVRMKEHGGESSPYPNAQKLISQVKIKDGYYPIAQYLLGDVFVVNNLNDAVNLWKSNGIDKTFVTPEGEVIDPQGVITGGYSNGKDAGILQKRREIKDLSLAVSDLEKKIAEIENEAKRLKYEAEASQRSIEGLKKDSHSKEIELVNIEAELKREEAEMRRLKQRLEVLAAELSDAAKEQEAIAIKKTQLLKDRETGEAELKEIETTIQTITDEVSNLYKKKDELSGFVTDIKVKLASSKQRLENIEGQIEDKKTSLSDIESRIREKQAEVENGESEAAGHEIKAARMKAELEDALKTMDHIRRDEIRQEEFLNQITTEANQYEEALNEIKKDTAQLQEDVNSVNLNLREMELNLTHLFEKMTERYGVAIDSYVPSEDMKAVEREAMTVRMNELKTQIADLGEVSLGAIEEYKELETRHQFLMDQQADLNNSVDSLHKVINRINRTTRQRFRETFDAINLKFQEVFPKFFRGGKAELRLVDEGDLLESGIEIVAQPPGKRLQNISLLSGGEKALTATSLIFSIFLIKPSPFCLLDEVDAPLDDANIDRFNGFLKEMAKKSQFILITHNKGTMEIADTLFGVTMEEAGVSKIVSVQLN